MHINEMEEYLGILWEKKAVIQLTLAVADDQIGAVGEALDRNGIPETSLSDNDDNDNDNNSDNRQSSNDIPLFLPDNFTMNPNMPGSSDTESDHNSTTSCSPTRAGCSSSDQSAARNFVKEWQAKAVRDGVFSGGSV